MSYPTIELRRPTAKDGRSVHQLVAQCPPLDSNSMYCNLLQSAHFSATSVAAFSAGDMVGFISGYLIPERPDTLFVWQVAVGQRARGQGLATRMLRHIQERPACSGVAFLETTITASNQASWALFRGLAKQLDAALSESVMFDSAGHFGHEHDTEMLVRIGPF